MHEQEIPVQWRYKLDHSRWSEWLECDFRETGTYSGRVEFRRKPPPTSGEAVAVACQQSAAPRLRAVYTSPIGDPVHLGTLRAGRYMLPNLGILTLTEAPAERYQVEASEVGGFYNVRDTALAIATLLNASQP